MSAKLRTWSIYRFTLLKATGSSEADGYVLLQRINARLAILLAHAATVIANLWS